MVGFEKYLREIKHALTTDVWKLQVVSIVGMGGIGKTTLATAVYSDSFIVEHFHVRAWVTVSQRYTARELLIRLLHCYREPSPRENQCSDDEIGELLYKELFVRRYLIVMDDVWDVEAWDQVKRFFPDNENGSRVLVTTRESNLNVHFEPCKIDFLDKGQSWDLLCRTIFRGEDCPDELKDIGKVIAERCVGLPLALVVIGGLLAKFERTREHWDSVARDISSALRYGDDEHVMKILSLSYIHLPIYLKPCFLYLSVYREDCEIGVSNLVRHWIAEGLIKPSQAKCLEEVAHEYLENLISRNLILSHRRGDIGNVRSCKIHDFVRNLCIAEAEKEVFLYMTELDNRNLLRIIRTEKCLRDDSTSNIDFFKLNNFRYVDTFTEAYVASMSRCWNLQTLVSNYYDGDMTLPVEMWQMPQLRHLKMANAALPDPPPHDEDLIVLENLQTLKTIRNLKLTEEVLKRIPNLKKLGISYGFESSFTPVGVLSYSLSKLVCFKKLESLQIYGDEILRWGVTFPISLKKLTLENFKFAWEDMSVVGSLPDLEVLKLFKNATKGKVWNPIEGQFLRLKFLMIYRCELKIWRAENYHFPCLERLVLRVKKLKRIPMSFAEILTLEVINLGHAIRAPVGRSARKISKQRVLLGYEPLQLHFVPMRKVVVKVFDITSEDTKSKAMKAARTVPGVDSIAFDVKDGNLTVIGEMHLASVMSQLRKVSRFELLSVGPAKRIEKKKTTKGRRRGKYCRPSGTNSHLLPKIDPSITIGMLGVLLRLWQVHCLCTYYNILSTRQFDPPSKLILCFWFATILFAWWPVALEYSDAGVGLMACILLVLLFPVSELIFDDYQAIEERESKKFYHFIFDGTRDTVSLRRSFLDFSGFWYYFYMSIMDDVRCQGLPDGDYYEIRWLYVPLVLIAGVVCITTDLPLISVIAVCMSPNMLVKGWHWLLHDIGREGPFLGTICVPFAGLAILLWLLVVAAAVSCSVVSIVILAAYAAVLYQDCSFWFGVFSVVGSVFFYGEYSNDVLEYSNDVLDLPEVSFFPIFQPLSLCSYLIESSRPHYREKATSLSTFISRRSSSKEPPSLANFLGARILELKPLELADALFKECQRHGQVLVSDGVISVKDIEDAKNYKSGSQVISVGLPAYCILRTLVLSAKADSAGILLSDKYFTANRPKDTFSEWFLNPLLIIKDQIRADNLSESEEQYLGKLVLFGGDPAMEPESEMRRAELDALARRLQGITKSVSRYPTFRHRFDQCMQRLLQELGKKNGDGSSEQVQRSKTTFARIFAQKSERTNVFPIKKHKTKVEQYLRTLLLFAVALWFLGLALNVFFPCDMYFRSQNSL